LVKKKILFFQRQRSPDYDELDRRPLPPSFTTIPPPSSVSRRYDYDNVRQQQEREDEIYRRRLLQEQQAAAEQVTQDFSLELEMESTFYYSKVNKRVGF